ncbi:MAG: TlpA disulfide reductase family protein [Actinomycetota bacterium]|nr:TlpA disulfide reductase family protein [Actinomycetota bacterium]
MVEDRRSEIDSRGRKIRIGALASLAIVVAFSVIVASVVKVSTSQQAASNLIGKAVPGISGTTLEGQKIDYSAFKGRYLLVNFFASWCIPCKAETSSFVNFLQSAKSEPYGSKLAIVGVTVNDRMAQAKAFANANGITWPVIYDATGVVALKFGVVNPPQTFLVAPNGTVVTRVVGQVTLANLKSVLGLAYATYG